MEDLILTHTPYTKATAKNNSHTFFIYHKIVGKLRLFFRFPAMVSGGLIQLLSCSLAKLNIKNILVVKPM